MNNENLREKATALNRQGEHRKHGEIREIAAIDLGSNSFHMIIARIVNGSIQILSRLKQKVQLAAGLDQNNVLSQEAITRGVNCLALFAERLQGFAPQDVNVVGTYTLRSAVNKEEFLAQAHRVFPYPIRIISGETEARMIYAGVAHTQPEQGRKLVIDIGGGSTEMIIGDNFQPLVANSRDMGCVSFAKTFFPGGIISEARFRQARAAALSRIEDLADSYLALGWESVLGSSGTIKTVHQVICAAIDANGIINTQRLETLIERTLKAAHFNELRLAGLPPERADVFVSGLAILSAVFETFSIQNMRYSDGALREGVMYSLEDNFQVANIRQRTAEGLAEQFNIDPSQAERVGKSALLLARQFKAWRNKGTAEEMQEILLWAALLHEVGIVINHNGMQRHSAYILQHIELPGFDREQQHLLSALVRYQIRAFRAEDIPSFSRYDSRDVLSLIRLLRLAVLLNKSRQATDSTEDIRLNAEQGGEWRLCFEKDYLRDNPLLENDLAAERFQLQEAGLGLEFE
ncbi:exopolyphosphatase/guanosine-5'-triphosphate,3'-diphosphate pyrophosphatase [Mesocricetibacter intestinalis]|uniref:Exopolyphosphatase n=1 Tax=Mesocricetibacter intestinalis TaxID=1521930 RepID=A0A4R6VHA1_9PAST|nr:exopolyphosphatase [Mesocricetibacter intestinalis]TDQ57598.1 exopolyphosphatase/guanosine-5'-triphosphate,3'-diphosphate pyrophosphatase [Mesocricetibacter intestinalis]